MKKELKDLWVAVLRDPHYTGKEAWDCLNRLSQNGTQRYNVWGVLYEVLKQQPAYQDALASRVEEKRNITRLPSPDVDRRIANALVLTLTVDGDEKQTAFLPTALREYAGLEQVPDEAVARLIELNKSEASFPELADFIKTSF
jgi:hypothetical protein